MKRMHIHMTVNKLDESIRFYNALFGEEPVKQKDDYAKWMLEDPRVNFAVSTHADNPGVDHLGIQVEHRQELDELRDRFKEADLAAFDEGEVECCYARADKSWLEDPAGVAWESYRTMHDVRHYGSGIVEPTDECCTEETKGQPGCCESAAKTAPCCT